MNLKAVKHLSASLFVLFICQSFSNSRMSESSTLSTTKALEAMPLETYRGNSIRVENRVTKWRKECNTGANDWLEYKGTVVSKRLPNCVNNLLLYEITTR